MNIFEEFVPERFFEKFPENHLLVKASKGEADIPDNIRNAVIQYCMPKGNKRVEIDALSFWTCFCARIKNMIDYFGEEEMEEFFSSQLSAGKENYDENTLLQALSEVECISYALCILQDCKTAIYEPKTNGNKNPEARIVSKDKNAHCYDIEVKTPKFDTRKDYIKNKEKFFRVNIPIAKTDLVVLREYVEKRGYKFILPSLLKIKDYINSAGEKFIYPATPEQCNILFVNWTFDDIYESNLMQPIACLCNEKTGLLKTNKFHESLKINSNALKKISAIVIYKDTVDSFVGLNLATAIQTGNCKIIINDVFCEHVDRKRILEKMQIPEAVVEKDGANFQIFGNFNFTIREHCDEAEEIASIVNEILDRQ